MYSPDIYLHKLSAFSGKVVRLSMELLPRDGVLSTEAFQGIFEFLFVGDGYNHIIFIVDLLALSFLQRSKLVATGASIGLKEPITHLYDFKSLLHWRSGL